MQDSNLSIPRTDTSCTWLSERVGLLGTTETGVCLTQAGTCGSLGLLESARGRRQGLPAFAAKGSDWGEPNTDASKLLVHSSSIAEGRAWAGGVQKGAAKLFTCT